MSNKDDRPDHVCFQQHRLLRIEDELAQLEARRRTDVELTAQTMRDLGSMFGDAVDRITEAGGQLRSVARQVKALFAKVDALAARLDARNGKANDGNGSKA